MSTLNIIKKKSFVALRSVVFVGLAAVAFHGVALAESNMDLERQQKAKKSIDAAIDELIMTFRPPVMTARGSVHVNPPSGRGSALIDVETMRAQRRKIYQQLELLRQSAPSEADAALPAQ